jgi:2-polyprenyl-3-methyl-5-hydroxy-6-metoxy-1,4-benzoquinol methylase
VVFGQATRDTFSPAVPSNLAREMTESSFQSASFLTASGYRRDPETDIWLQPGYGGIAYSDGDDVEERIANIISEAQDVSLFSRELNGRITDWPSRYHLSATRANIVRPFRSQFSGSDVLEIGAGCGAITRFLGECGANVLALEGTLRRASIARARTRGMSNVEVVADNFTGFRPGRKFDIITLIGVLEYASLFIGGEQPALRMLNLAREMLEPDGRIIIAIENQLGLKYVAGAPEDHIGQSVYGIEGRYKSDQPRTYGRRELVRMIRIAGFVEPEVLAPFPDYKFTASILTESGFDCKEFNSGALASESVGLDPQLPSDLTFSPELTWPILVENGIALDLANSFLVVAGQSPCAWIDSSVLAFHYSTNRSKDYCKEVQFVRTTDHSIQLRYSGVEGDPSRYTGKHFRFSIPEESEYVRGNPLSQDLTNITIRDGWKMEEVGEFVRRYIEIVASLAGKPDNALKIDRLESPLSGRHFDLISRNIIVGLDGLYYAIDQEWESIADVSIGFLVFRSLKELLYSKFRLGKTASEFKQTRVGFMIAAYGAAGFEVQEDAVTAYARLEAEAQSDIAQRDVKLQEVWSPDAAIQSKAMLHTYKDVKGKYRRSQETLAQKKAELKDAIERLRQLERSPSGKLIKLFGRLRFSK